MKKHAQKEKIKIFLKENFFGLWCVWKGIKYICWKEYHRRAWGYIKNYKYYRRHPKTIYIVTSPEYGNLGDHAIAMAEMELAKRMFPKYQIEDITDSQFNERIWLLRRFANEEDLIFLIGGGNFGLKYYGFEYIRRNVISFCRKTKIIMFPQTFNYGDGRYDQCQLKKSVSLYSKNRKLALFFREETSYKRAQIFNNYIAYMPDIVLTWKPNVKRVKTDPHEIGLCMREDSEKIVSDELVEQISGKIVRDGFDIKRFDTDLGSVTIKKEEREDRVKEILSLISSCRFIITDRLHGLVFSYITGTPCLFLNNYDKKLSGINQWIHSEHIKEFSFQSAAEDQIEAMYGETHFIPEQEVFYEKFVAEIRKIVELNEMIKGCDSLWIG